MSVVIVSAARTPIGRFLGGLSSVPAPQLGAIAIKGALAKIQLKPELVDEVLMGNVIQAGVGQAPAQQASILAGIPVSASVTTVNKLCASGLKAVMQGTQAILSGDAQTVVVGGMENMSLIPHTVHLRNGHKYGSTTLEDCLQKDGLLDPYDQNLMGVYGDLCAKAHKVSREEQDAFAIASYQRSTQAWETGKFKKEVVPVPVPQRKGEDLLFDRDEEYTNINLEKLPTLKPAFSKDGTVTAANASTLNDGAAALVLMSEEKAMSLGLKPLATIRGYADASQAPSKFPTTPALALPKALKKANLSLEDIDYFEFNEAFSVVGIANAKILGIDLGRINVNGGAVSLGHPLGCSGARILVTLIHVLEQNDARFGAAAICNGGGGASAIVIERN